MRVAIRIALVVLAATALVGQSTPAQANVAMTRIGTDSFTNTGFQHRTAVGSDSYQNGTTIFTASLVGRGTGSASAGVSYAAYNKQQGTWTNGVLTTVTTAVSDVRVAYFLWNYNIWMIATLTASGPDGRNSILVSRSTDNGRSFPRPPGTAATGKLSSLWFTCGFASWDRNCYLGYTDTAAGNALRVRVSPNGGLDWGPELSPADGATGFAGNAIVRDYDGGTVVPYVSTTGQIRAFRTTDFGRTWSASVPVGGITRRHAPAGGLRDIGLPSVQQARDSTLYVAWSDCRFRIGCAANDIVFSRSPDGVSWSAPRRVPIDATTSGVDHFLPAIGVDFGSGWDPDKLALAYHYYPDAACTADTCQLNIGFISSINEGATWSAPIRLAGPMRLSWLPRTALGRTVGDKVTVDVAWAGNAFPIVPVAFEPSGSTFNQAIYAPTGGVPVTGGSRPAG